MSAVHERVVHLQHVSVNDRRLCAVVIQASSGRCVATAA